MRFTVCVIGLGYVGLPTAVLLASAGNNVIGVDSNKVLLDELVAGYVRNQEPGLTDYLRTSLASGKLTLADKPKSADYYIICVPTPIDSCSKPDLSYLWSAIDALVDVISSRQTVIIESTIPVGTTLSAEKRILDHPLCEDKELLNFAHCPERVLPGNAINEIKTNSRVIGGLTSASAESAAKLYRTFCNSHFTLCHANIAEFSKLAENAYRDVNIAFANELSMMCEAEGISATDVISIANLHPRVDILSPGIGVGGHCIPVDPLFLVTRYPHLTALIQSARSVNKLKEGHSYEKIVSMYKSSKCDEIVIYGLTYKQDVDDTRESPALRIASALNTQYPGSVSVIDPMLDEGYILYLGLTPSSIGRIKRSSLVVILVEHSLQLGTLLEYCSNLGINVLKLT